MRFLILRDDVARQAAMICDSQAVVSGPGPYLPTARPAGGCPRPPCPSEPGLLEERGQQVAESRGMSGIQVDFVGPAVNSEVHGLVGRAAGQVILESDVHFLHASPWIPADIRAARCPVEPEIWCIPVAG